MATFTRRDFVRGVAAIPFTLWLSERLAAAPARVRHDVRSPKGIDMLKIYAGAVAAMKKLAETDPSNWQFQWYTHFVRRTTDKQSEISRVFGSAPSPHKELAQAMWNTCRSHSGQDSNLFLPWHRMYVYYFEEIIRAVSGEPEFTLPYWNYSAGDATHGKLPPQFLNGADPVFGPLFVSDRNALANNGEPIDKPRPGALNLDALKEPNYSPSGSAVQGFCLKLDSVLHGNVHVLTGAGQNMGDVPWAAKDPIFWLHHCNIDRLWASWNANGGKNPDAPWGSSVFTFADAKGNKVTGKASDFFDIAKLGYSYEKLEPRPKSRMRLESPGRINSVLTAKAAKGVALGAAPVVVTLDLSGGANEAAVKPSLFETVQKLPDNRRLYVVLRGLQAQAQPEVLYSAYIGVAGKEASVSEENFLGTFSFFDALKLDHGEGGHEHGEGDRFYSFDATDVLKRLGAGNLLGDKPAVVIVPAGEPASAARPVVATIELQQH